jgi:hypothetical protein
MYGLPVSANHDRLAKCILEEIFDPVGIARREFEIEPGYLRRADFLFQPVNLPPEQAWPPHLRMAFSMVQQVCLFEICSTPPDEDEMLDLHCKQMNLRNRRRQQGETGAEAMPRLWVLCWGRPAKAFAALGVEPDKNQGFHRLSLPWMKVGIIVLPELERTRQTLVLRLMGPPRIREEALAEIQAIPPTDPEYMAIHTLLAALRHAIERDKLIPEEEKQAFMTPARAEIERLLTRAKSEGTTLAMRALLQDTFSLRFDAPLPSDLVDRLQATEDAALLRRAHAVAISATDQDSATEQLRSLLPAN